MTITIDTPATEQGAVAFIPLNRLKKSPRNARRMPHSTDAIEALAASIGAKTMLQSPVVEPEYDEAGQPTGSYFVTIGEGRRLAQLLRAKRKEIKKTEAIRCLIDTAHDPHEISLDENVTRSAMHPADQFEAFQRLAEERGLGAEEIAARFGVSATVVRQRLKLAGISPRLMQSYRDGDMTLDHLMAFTVSEDHERQEALWESLSEWDRTPHGIRRHLTRDRVSASDRRAVFVGVDAYQAAGGVIERDLFAEDHGGYYADPALLDRLVREKLEAVAETVIADGWKWASLDPDYSLSRLYPEVRPLTEEEQALYDRLRAEQEALEVEHDDWSEEKEARFRAIPDEIDALETARLGFAPEDKARAGAVVTLSHRGRPRIDYGFVRPEDAVSEADTDHQDESGEPADQRQSAPKPEPGRAGLSDTLVADLTANKTAALRDALAQQPEVALRVLLHALMLRTFDCAYTDRTCLELRPQCVALSGYAPGIEESPAGRAIAERHEGWAVQLGTWGGSAWGLISRLTPDETLWLLAHCVSQSISAVETRDRPWDQQGPADELAQMLSLDMTPYWTPTAGSYFGRVNKSRILEAVTEAVSEDAARHISTAKKGDMADAAEQLIAGTGWLPEPLRTLRPEAEVLAQAAE